MENQGFAICLATCCACQKSMIANIKHAPSLRIKNGKPDPNGKREPVCETCFNLWNKIHRTDKGLEPVPLHPMAYSYTDLSDEGGES